MYLFCLPICICGSKLISLLFFKEVDIFFLIRGDRKQEPEHGLSLECIMYGSAPVEAFESVEYYKEYDIFKE